MQTEARLLQQHFGQQQAERQAERQAEQPWQHEAVVEDVASDARGSRGVEVDRRDDRPVVGNEEVVVDRHQRANQDRCEHPGIIISCIGIVGVYLGKTFDQTKGRPTFIIDEEV